MHDRIEVAWRGIQPSEELERYIDEQARELKRICDRIQGCQVVVEVQQRQKQRDAQFAVRLAITLPGTEIVVNREHSEDPSIALRDAFAAAGLQLADHVRRRSTPGGGNTNSPG